MDTGPKLTWILALLAIAFAFMLFMNNVMPYLLNNNIEAFLGVLFLFCAALFALVIIGLFK